MQAERVEIAVLGAGPAGAGAALGLAALGYAVAVIAPLARRARPRRESFSARVVEALRALGLEEALAAVDAPGERVVRWAGDERALPGEAQVERAAFEAGLLSDLARRGVRVLRDEVVSATSRPAAADGAGSARIALASGGALEARFAIEARGRAAPSGSGRPRERGPETLCVVQRWRHGAGSRPGARTAVVSLANGWAWLADDGRGALATQLTLAAGDAPPRVELGASVARALRGDAWCRDLLGNVAPEGAPSVRSATAVLGRAFEGDAMLRAGDAALAVDPLSGNGVFQALSTALVAPAVVNTLLRKPERASLARSFYTERARELFLRFSRVSRDFYAQGAAHHGGAFWHARAAWPDAVSTHAHGDARSPLTGAARAAIALRAVVCDGWIEEREVVVTPERPLGTWQLAGVELAPLVRELARGARTERALAPLPDAAREPVRAWLRAHGLG